jgi:hypothetical protein
MKLTREQELYLIDLGVASLLDSAMHNGNGHHSTVPDELSASIAAQTGATKKPGRRQWTPEQHAKFMATLRKKRRGKSASA